MVDASSGLEETDEKLFKVLVIGDYATGKTSLIKRYTEDTFSGDYKVFLLEQPSVSVLSFLTTAPFALAVHWG
eukprot:m.55138 g.55138  ORF g.55138 m.55138 type:complete len:73 (+) comp13650_c1_seq19:560-778(+)